MKSLAEKLKSAQCRRILEALDASPMSLGDLVKLTKLTAGSVAKHLEVLELAGLVETSPTGTVAAKR